MTRILILDDDRELLFMIGLILERAGYEHLIATEGTEAWTLLNTESIDLFILDPFVPDVDGWEFCRLMEMNETLYHIPIIIYTSRTITFDSAYQLPKMVAGYIIKPFAVPDFLRAVKNALEEHGKPLPTSTEVEYWANFRTKPVEERLATLRDHNPATRRRAVWSLWQKQEVNEKVVQALINMLGDEDWLVRLSAVRILAHLKDQQAIEPLQKLVIRVSPEKLQPQSFTKQTLNTQWDVEVSLARWAQWAIKQIEVRK